MLQLYVMGFKGQLYEEYFYYSQLRGDKSPQTDLLRNESPKMIYLYECIRTYRCDSIPAVYNIPTALNPITAIFLVLGGMITPLYHMHTTLNIDRPISRIFREIICLGAGRRSIPPLKYKNIVVGWLRTWCSRFEFF